MKILSNMFWEGKRVEISDRKRSERRRRLRNSVLNVIAAHRLIISELEHTSAHLSSTRKGERAGYDEGQVDGR
jgi:hypothetical protein